MYRDGLSTGAPGYFRLVNITLRLGISSIPRNSLNGVSDARMDTIAQGFENMHSVIDTRHVIESERDDMRNELRFRCKAFLIDMGDRI